MKKFLRNNGLSLVLAALFGIFWIFQAVSGWKVHQEDSVLHGRAPIGFRDYLVSGHFWAATGENWESEFLQMGAYVILTCFLYQKGSAESNDPDAAEDPQSSRRPVRSPSWLYRNSLSLAFFLLFLGAFSVHAAGGLIEQNEERVEHGLSPETAMEFLSGPDFWFQSFQNWQSEFLAVLSIVVLSIFLRQEGSPESKKVTDPDSKTGD